jgi:hypothetical protein
MATVFPEPVCDEIRRSRPRDSAETTAFWTAVRSENPRAVRVSRIGAGSSANGSISAGCVEFSGAVVVMVFVVIVVVIDWSLRAFMIFAAGGLARDRDRPQVRIR